MKRPIITAEILQSMLVDSAFTVGSTVPLQVPAHAVFTPSAMDMVRGKGIVLCRTAEPPGETAADEEAVSFASVRQAVLEKLPADLRTSPLVDALIRKALQQGVDTPVRTTLGVDFQTADVDKVQNAAPWRSEAGGIVHIDSHCLPWQDLARVGVENTVNVVDVLGKAENAPFGVGYLEWSAAGFDWETQAAELNVVLEGELHVTVQGKTVKATVGDVLLVPMGMSVHFESPGYVKFVYVTCYADVSGA